MSKRLLILIACLGGVFLTPAMAVAQNETADVSAALNYDRMTTDLIENHRADFEYGMLRNLYIRTPQYDPIADRIKDRMLRLSYKAMNETDSMKSLAALTEYRELVKNHMAHVGVVTQAQSLARQDSRLGNPDLYAMVRKGLMQNVLASGDGLTVNRAYEIITLDEEFALLAALKVEVVDTQTDKSGIIYYNMHSVIDADNRPFTVFVNLTTPMMYLENYANRKKNTFTLRPQ